MNQHVDCLILGGGVIGLTLALELRRRGRDVTVIERGQVGREASWAGAGILPPPLRENVDDPLDRLRALSHRLHFELAEQLREDTGLDTGLRRCGGLYLARSAGEAAALIGLKSLYEEHDVRAELLSGETVKEREPELAAAVEEGRIQSALECPDEAQLRNPWHLAALKAACEQRHVALLESVEAESIACQDGEAQSVATSRGSWTADIVIVAAGAWAVQLLEPLGLHTGVFPVRGQMVLYRCERPPLTRIINEGPRYIVPRDDGHCLVGSCEEEAGYEKAVTDAVQRSLEAFARELAPSLSDDRVVDRWSGLRPASFDGFPYIGRVGAIENLFVAVGHFRSGIHLSTGTAHVLAQLICGETASLDLNAFSPTRG